MKTRMQPRPARLAVTDVVRVGSAGLRSRRLRASLSALGIAIGIASVVSVLSISSSAQADLLDQLGRLGNLLTVESGRTIAGQPEPLPSTAPGMIGRIPPVRAVSAIGLVPGATVRRTAAVPAAASGGISVLAVDGSLLRTLDATPAHGAFLNPATAGYPTVVLGAAAAQQLGISRSTMVPQVYVGGHYFAVLGVLRAVPLAPEIDEAALVGYPVAQSLLHFDGRPTKIYLRTDPDQVIPVESVLARTTNPDMPEAVSVSRPSDVLAARASAKGAFTGLFLGLGAVALLVGGVGVGNVMVISVLERRSEIGVRRALGATRGQVGLQFVTESLLLCAAGGVLGAGLGIAATGAYARIAALPMSIPPVALYSAVASALTVGVLAGLYPALRATRLAPAEVLRSA